MWRERDEQDEKENTEPEKRARERDIVAMEEKRKQEGKKVFVYGEGRT